MRAPSEYLSRDSIKNWAFESPNVPRTARAGRGLMRGFKWGTEGAILWGLPLMAFEIATSSPGDVVPTTAARLTGTATYPVFAGLATAAVAVLIPGIGLGAAALLGGVLAMYPNALVEDSLQRNVRRFSQFDRERRRLQMGGDYQDTQLNSSMRQRAVAEMNSTAQASRRYLGREALLMHR